MGALAPVLTVAQAAEAVGVDRRTLYRWTQLPHNPLPASVNERGKVEISGVILWQWLGYDPTGD